MKVLKFILPLILLQCAVLVSSDTDLNELMKQLTRQVKLDYFNATMDVLTQSLGTLAKISEIMATIVVPSIKEFNERTENYIKKLENKTLSSGYNIENCTKPVIDLLKSDKLPNITEIAISDLNSYFEIVRNDYLMAYHKVNVTYKELDSISAEYDKCLLSEQAQYCNHTLSEKISAKLEEFPILFSKDVQRSNLTFIQEVANYVNGVPDYVQLAATIIKPYINLLESCVAEILAVGNENDIFMADSQV